MILLKTKYYYHMNGMIEGRWSGNKESLSNKSKSSEEKLMNNY